MELSTLALILIAFLCGIVTGHNSLKNILSKNGYEVEVLKSGISKRVFYRVQRKRLEPLEPWDNMNNVPYDYAMPKSNK